MRLILLYIFSGVVLFQLPAGDGKAPNWNNLLGLLLIVVIPLLIFFFVQWLTNKRKKRITVILEKNRLYFPDYIRMTVINNSRKAIDINNPLFVFSHLFLKRKLKLKGPVGHPIYPLYLEPGKIHELNIDLKYFYLYDRSLKKFPKATVYISDLTGKVNVSQSIQLRKTLFT